MPRYRCGPDHGHVTCCGDTEKYCSEDGYCSTIKHANNQDDYSECNNVCNECNDDCEKCCDIFFDSQRELCKAAPGAMAHFCLCGSADPFQSRGCGVDPPPFRDDESWVSPDEFDDIDAWGTGKAFRKMTCSGWYDMTKEVDGWTVPINAEWDGADPVVPPKIEEETLAKDADGKFVDVTPCIVSEDAKGMGRRGRKLTHTTYGDFSIKLACPIACGVTREDWLGMVADVQYPGRYFASYAVYYSGDEHHAKNIDDD